MNNVVLSGTVFQLTANNGQLVFNLSVAKNTKDQEKSFMNVRVRCFGQPPISERNKVIVSGQLDIYEYNGKWYTEVKCNENGIGYIYTPQIKQNNGYQQSNNPNRGYQQNNNPNMGYARNNYQNEEYQPPVRNNPYNDGMNGPESFEDDNIPF